MVNTGKPSTGCHNCRKRKVKCDEQRPQCRRCIAIHVECPGYRESNVTFFKNQSAWAKAKVRKRLGSTPSSTSSSSSSDPDTPSSASPVVATALAPFAHEFEIVSFRESRSLPRSPSVDPASLAVPRFYSDYVISKGFMPFLDFLPELYNKPKLDTCFEQALPAVALASASRQLRDYSLMTEAQRRYGQSLTALAKAIEDENRAKSDEIFMAVFLLGMFEIIASEKATSGIWDTHYKGRLALLRLRGTHQLKTKFGRDMFRVTHHQLFMNSFLGREQPTEDFLEWFIPLVSPRGNSNCILEFGRAAYRAAGLHATIAQAVDEAKQSKTVNKDRLVGLIREVMAFEHALTLGVQGFPEDIQTLRSFVRKRSKKPASIAKDHYQTMLGTSDELDEASALAWNQYRTVRIHIFQVLHEASQLVGEADGLDIPELQERWEGLSAQTVEDFCATIPGLLGTLGTNGQFDEELNSGASYRGYMLLWPLRASIMAIGVSNERREWIASLLKCIGNTFGIGQASALAQLAPLCIEAPPQYPHASLDDWSSTDWP